MTDSLLPRLLLALGWAALVATALVILGKGLGSGFYIENTDTALAEARHGARLVALACLLLVGAAVLAAALSWTWAIPVGLLVPVVLCGGFTLLAPETLVPLMSVVVAYPVAVGAGLAGMVTAVRAT